MRIVLDANVIVAAAATRGLCQAVFEVCLERHELVLCTALLREVEQTLRGKLGLPAEIVEEYLRLLRDVAKLPEPFPVEPGSCRDRSDEAVLGAAVAGAADLIVTGDKDLLVIGQFRGTRIVTPRDFWEIMRSA